MTSEAIVERLPVHLAGVRWGEGGGWAGVALIVMAALAFSTAGLFTRVVATDVWTMLFWRGLIGGALIGGYVIGRNRAATRAAFAAVGRPGLLVGGCSTLGTICFLVALRQSTVAEVTVIYATAPFVAALVAWAWTGERQSRTTLAASLLALLGVAVMFGAVPSTGQLLGNLLALAMTVLIASMMVIIRRNRQVSMLPASCLSAFACALAVLPLADPSRVSAGEFLWLFLFGVQFGLGLLLLTIGTRLISATRASLLANLELPLAPFWVWLAFAEAPSAPAFIGGAVVLAAILLDLAVAQGRARTSAS